MASDLITPTSSPSKADRNVANEAFNHLVQGKRHLLVRDIPSAVTSLQQACQLLTTHYGELANECGDAYFCYGKALFEQAREETGVLGSAIANEEEQDEDKDDDDDDDDEEEEEEEEDDDEQEQQEEEDEQSDKSEELTEEDKENKPVPDNSEVKEESTTVVAESEPQPGPSNAEAKPKAKQNNEDGEEEEEISTLQLAWEVLELAKVIFARQAENNRDMQLKLADVHLNLGEVSLESGNFEEAIADMHKCLHIQEELLPQDDRCIAETHYHLAMAYTYKNCHDLAIENFEKAYEVIESKVNSLKMITAGKDVEPGKIFVNEDDPVAVAQRDIDELSAILPEIKERISDMNEAKSELVKALGFAAKNFTMNLSLPEEPSQEEQLPSNSSPLKEPGKPASNIGHLVKRKRKCDETPEKKPNDVEPKKSRPDSTLETNNLVQGSERTVPPSRDVAPIANASADSSKGEGLPDNSEVASSSERPSATRALEFNVASSDDPVSSSTDCKVIHLSSSVRDNAQISSRDVLNGEISQSEVQ